MTFNKIKNLVLPIFAILFFMNCEKEMLLTEFTDYDFEYEPEILIEAILQAENPEKTVVRIDKTIPVTDTTIYNGIDDDDDWVGYEDVNGNGQWDADEPLNDDLGADGMASSESEYLTRDEGEGDGLPTEGEPHIDELDEIISQVHQQGYTVELYKKASDVKVADFTWLEQADSLKITTNYYTEQKEIIYYSGYKVSQLYEDIDYDDEYEFRITKDNDEISASFDPEPPVEFLTDYYGINNDTLVIMETDSLAPVWACGNEPIVFWVKVEKIFSDDSTEVLVDYPSIPFKLQDGIYIGADFPSRYFPGLYKWTVYVPSRNYGQYVYSELPITDSSISNWRDQNGNVILGCAGAMAEKSIYVRIKEVEEEDLEIVLTK